MYLNLDLLYNVDIYLFPLFYYNINSIHSQSFVYCPITKKSAYQYNNYNYDYIYYDHITNLCKCKNNKTGSFYYDIDFITRYYTKCKPIFLDKEHIKYLKSNKRIARNVS